MPWPCAAHAFAVEALYSVLWTWSFTVSLKSTRLGRLSSMNVRSMGLLKAAHNWANTSSRVASALKRQPRVGGWTNATRPRGDAHPSLSSQGQFLAPCVCCTYIQVKNSRFRKINLSHNDDGSIESTSISRIFFMASSKF